MTISYQSSDYSVLENIENLLKESSCWISNEELFKGETILEISFKEEISKNILIEKINESNLKYKIKINF